MMNNINRNNVVDGIRGLAMLLVVLGHTISGSVVVYQDSFLLQVIWTLQMPLFIIISGYVTKYGKPITTINHLLVFIKKRTLSYLLPWSVWTFVVRGLIFGQSLFFDFKYLIWHMDSGYWFLITIWTISIIYGIADYLSNLKKCKRICNVMIHILVCIIGMAGLLILGLKFGLDFCCIKLTLYYIPFYLIGYLYGQIQNELSVKSFSDTLINGITSISLATWLFLICHYDFYSIGDSGIEILSRFVTSLLGCIAIIGLFSGFCQKGETCIGFVTKGYCFRFVEWIGRTSLSVYLIHYLFLCIINNDVFPVFHSLSGWVIVSSNYLITILLSVIMIKIIESNKLLNKILFWK